MKKTLLNTGFTLIELLVVVAIIGILTAILSANFFTAKSKSRDAKRVSDLSQLQLSLEQVFDKCNQYPNLSTLDLTTTVCTVNGVTYNLGSFMSTLPKDPTTAAVYSYGTASPYTDYVLKASLENWNAVLSDDVDGTPFTGITCDEGANKTSPFSYCVQPK